MHGLLLVDKPSGMTSHDVVSRVRRLANTKEVGHSGTLDPLASGLMVVLIGEATKLSSIVTEGDKAYEVQLQLGIETDTLDITGQVEKTTPVNLKKDDVVAAALKLMGEMQLPIPLYSAKKIDGKKLYEYAREGEAVEIPSKSMTFWDVTYVENLEAEKEHRYSFHLQCSKGSFIRSWVKLLGEQLGCGAAMSALRRTKSHDFGILQAQPLNDLLAEKEANTLDMGQKIVPMTEAVSGVRIVKIDGHDELLLNNGQISHDLRTKLIVGFNPDKDQWVFASSKATKQVLAIIGIEPEQGFKIKRCFRY
ncbi:tRNA pseudouridine(55) synthase TruB [Bdellovibrio sp. qaytius]|nr:tRNA pseudouridine(55) synthase TruB [Bdellovibrio sp. qaytius]